VGVLWALRRGYDIAAGILLALTTIKPQMSILLVPALLLWGVGQRRWRFVGGFGAVMLFLLGISFVLLPSWLAEFLRQVTQYPSYTAIGSPVWVIAQYYLPQLGLGLSQAIFTALEVGLSALLLVYLLVEWRRLPQVTAGTGAFHWLVGLTLIVTNLIVLRTATTNFVALYIPLFFVLKAAVERSPARYGGLASRLAGLTPRHAGLTLFYFLSAVGLWVLFFTTVQGKFEHPIMYLPLPFGLLIAFVWGKPALHRMAAARAGVQ
jgi:hypothetical protein